MTAAKPHVEERKRSGVQPTYPVYEDVIASGIYPTCRVCRQSLPPEKYNRYMAASGREYLRRECRDCGAARLVRWRQRSDNLQRGRDRTKESSRIRSAALREIVNKAKAETPCADCGGRFHPVAMDFDHIDATQKVSSIARIVKDGKSAEVLRAEMAKCEIVCANCHRVRTAMRGQWGRRSSSKDASGPA